MLSLSYGAKMVWMAVWARGPLRCRMFYVKQFFIVLLQVVEGPFGVFIKRIYLPFRVKLQTNRWRCMAVPGTRVFQRTRFQWREPAVSASGEKNGRGYDS